MQIQIEDHLAERLKPILQAGIDAKRHRNSAFPLSNIEEQLGENYSLKQKQGLRDDATILISYGHAACFVLRLNGKVSQIEGTRGVSLKCTGTIAAYDGFQDHADTMLLSLATACDNLDAFIEARAERDRAEAVRDLAMKANALDASLLNEEFAPA